jgi:hypothetical protein
MMNWPSHCVQVVKTKQTWRTAVGKASAQKIHGMPFHEME